jgi:hypothetical protein
MTKTFKFSVVSDDKQAVEITFYNRSDPVTAVEMFDMFHAFCMSCGIPEVTYRYQIYNLTQAYQTPPAAPAGGVNATPSMGMKPPESPEV